LREVHRVVAVSQAERLAIYIAGDGARDQRVTLVDLEAGGQIRRGRLDPHLEVAVLALPQSN
jgi:hypothetical protein